MGIPFDLLPSCGDGWKDGLHFATELRDWTVRYEEEVCKPVATNDQYLRVYVDSALSSLPSFLRTALRNSLGADLGGIVRLSLNAPPSLESPGLPLSTFLALVRNLRKLGLRHLALPRPDSSAVKIVDEALNPETKLYNFGRKSL
ncbi:hypothetical protein BDP81DRAFT_455993 [Colletotrichum phormii]|uniref:Uncharacterized protein n=1 Tax=Colletotrichum phormii TaxID=359342 RepID=A0AAI9ZBX5_9PEZI|nr:uncharacterized protein BDP81DRAFT_455993 [Colletotrichum phormii]KAK1621683.1 hypothetical protein BDP81DRAFT_455993 [Colletotrichum phormii]